MTTDPMQAYMQATATPKLFMLFIANADELFHQ